MSRQPLTRTSTEGRTIAVVGDVYRFLATGDETDGRYAQWEAIVPPGGGPPPHVHSREDEGFYVVEGTITFHLGEESFVATPGMSASMPSGVPHSFKNETNEPAKMILTVAPAGLEGMFFEVGTAVPQGTTMASPPSHEEMEKLGAIASKYGIEIRLPTG